MVSPSRPATIGDVAARAGVSKAAASQALSGKGRISEATRARIAAVAAELEYRPNSTAQNLSSARAGIVGVLLPAHSEHLPFSHQLALGALVASEPFRSTVRILTPDLVAPHTPPLRLDGCVIVDPVAADPHVRTVLGWGVPTVCIEPPLDDALTPDAALTSRHDRAVRELLEHLRARGARRIALPVPELGTRWTADYLRGAAEWAAQTGIPVTHIPIAPAAEAAGPELTHEIVAQSSGYDAAIFVSDRAAIAAAFAAATAGRRVGEDFLLASYLDSDYLTAAEPRITAMHLDPAGLGRAAIELLHEVIAAREAGAASVADRVRELIPHVRARASTAGTTRA